MLWKTHLAFGLLAALITRSFVNTGNIFIFFALVLIGALLPDIDHPNSKINQKLKITKIFGYIFKHRGIFHTLFFALLLPGLIYFSVGKPYGTALFIGYLSHLLIDGLTVSGINFLHPIANLRISGFVETGTMAETMTFIVIIFAIIINIL
ncbi:metal-dependent hydrolase [Nanoarchaeota archaeon]